MSLPHCDYFEAGRCRSCALIETPYAEQLRAKEARCRELLPELGPGRWLPSVEGGDRDFRNKAKLVVGGGAGAVTLGILGPDGSGVDLRDCLIQSPGLRAAIPRLATFLDATGLPPYDVPARRGELKFAHLTEAPSGELMVRFVSRTQEGLDRLRARLPELLRALPEARVVSVNLLPEHRAVLEGEREEVLHGTSLDMQLGGIDLHLRPRSFFQTNTAVARELYAQAADWVARRNPRSLWDLYCGVGGFALHLAEPSEQRRDGAGQGPGSGSEPATAPARRVLGVEISEEAVRSARRSAADAGLAAAFLAEDATAFALASAREDRPEAIIVNPPRRGIGAELADWIEDSGVDLVVYSSCNPESLAKDLTRMPAYEIAEARVFDMFPHTNHLEVMVLLTRGSGSDGMMGT
ncbi:methyltransferase domain-containing protein [Leucobacter sp. CSA2]|uniref:Methyltransferase domain-containing protein n=1 Tax=Leucobacter edaphi TaxID=2796472 RepID=A0A934QAK5_9MICO|nr:methyltransferase domain-containing protein [Leucobacter edaphi]MBK0421001.1 methyltransferase domain-containing protein [Leucobacter edaphi]